MHVQLSLELFGHLAGDLDLHRAAGTDLVVEHAAASVRVSITGVMASCRPAGLLDDNRLLTKRVHYHLVFNYPKGTLWLPLKPSTIKH